MGRRSRKRREAPAGEPATRAEPVSAPSPARPRRPTSEERNERIRANLEPLSPGERPRAVTVAVVVAVLMAVANVVAALLGEDLRDERSEESATSFTVLSTGLLLMAAGGMYRAKYWGVLGFQVILGFQIVLLSLALITVNTWYWAIVVALLAFALGWLFWSLVRSMARIQMPERRPPA